MVKQSYNFFRVMEKKVPPYIVIFICTQIREMTLLSGFLKKILALADMAQLVEHQEAHALKGRQSDSQ